ncbi:hypothetical protein ECP03048162_5134 [Escherichia coli P0304816.2]|nr:hypothetical protein ECP03048162_5134 [Escherichia coli P0304816.2]
MTSLNPTTRVDALNRLSAVASGALTSGISSVSLLEGFFRKLTQMLLS